MQSSEEKKNTPSTSQKGHASMKERKEVSRKSRTTYFFFVRSKLKEKTKRINIPEQLLKQGSPQTEPDVADGMGHECSWGHWHAVCHLLTWGTHQAGEAQHDRNIAGAIFGRRRERDAAPPYFVDIDGSIAVVPHMWRGCVRHYKTDKTASSSTRSKTCFIKT